jgi:predicted RNA-binding protein with PUA-like domain
MADVSWIVKQEPEDYSWEDFLQDKRTAWTGVRNFQARNHLRAMQVGDYVLFYHSGKSKELVGVAKVALTAYPDPTATEGDWSCVDLVPVATLPNTITLATLKATEELANLPLVRQSRLSVSPVSKAESKVLLKLGSLKSLP